jgi:hypothetical protein
MHVEMVFLYADLGIRLRNTTYTSSPATRSRAARWANPTAIYTARFVRLTFTVDF